MSFEEGLFIETIEQFPCLWDLKCPNHKDKLAIENAWTSIASVSEMSVDQCQDLWKSIRLKYVRERKFINDMPSGSASYSGVWPHFAKLGFLAPHIQIRKTKSNMTSMKRKTIPSEPIAGPSKVWRDMMVGDDGFLLNSPSATETESTESRGSCTETPVSEDFMENTITITDTPSVLRRQRSTSSKKIAAGSEEISRIAETCESVGQNLNLYLKQGRDEDQNKEKEDQYFGMSLGAMLSKIKNNKKKTLLKARILAMVAEELESDDE